MSAAISGETGSAAGAEKRGASRRRAKRRRSFMQRSWKDDIRGNGVSKRRRVPKALHKLWEREENRTSNADWDGSDRLIPSAHRRLLRRAGRRRGRRGFDQVDDLAPHDHLVLHGLPLAAVLLSVINDFPGRFR